jgi:RNA polymerase sigma-70 factor (ECF subfamily)
MSREDEHTLLSRVAAKDRRAFEALYQRYYRRLFGYLFKVTRRAEIVEEVLNDVMFTVWQSAGRFDGRSRPSSWILGIAYRKALKALSRLPLRPTEQREEEDDSVADEGPESLAVRREVASVLGRALAVLSPEQRAVVELTYFEGLSYREISDIVGCPVNTVKTRMFHARRRLRQVLPSLGVASHRG